ncbi:Tolloid-like protein 2 [Mizuhopecten yessoensis]|uniref:Tolloid-like protein 2 n=2 Tax=Mizuhopecten yessoensis TaxID=6573 RepID=A0A210Q4Z6_MIZYE|nr:Tolloid-like protein 2 [Mizuhopecten yessoensis]
MFQSWSIETEDSLNVVEVMIDTDIETCCDSLELFDGPNSEADSLGIFRGTYSGNKVTSSGRQMYVVFRSDSSVQRRGFRLAYKQVDEKKVIWMIVGIVLAVLITILSVCLILFLCGVCKSKDQVASIRPNYGQHQQPVWMIPRPQNHVQVVPGQFVPPPTYQDVTYQNQQAMDMQDMDRGVRPGTADMAMSNVSRDNIMVNSLPPRQHYERT